MTAADEKDPTTMQRLLTLAAVSAMGLAASGCQTSPTGALQVGNNPSVYSMHQPVVERTDYVFDLSTSGDGVAPTELERLSAWFESIDLSYGDKLTVDEPIGYESDAARRDIARLVAEYGMRLSDEAAPVTDGDVAPGTVRVVASRSQARVEGCPNWSNPGVASTSTTSTNYGCAFNSNLAAMIADPNDLVHGRDASVRGSGSTAARAIRVYRETQPTGRQGLPSTSTRSGSSQ